jgi:uncharacterized membrane protein YkvI
MLDFSVLFAIGGHSGSNQSLDLPNWVGYIIFPLAIIGIVYAWRKGGE